MAVPEVAEFGDESEGHRPSNLQECNCTIVDTDGNATVEDNCYSANDELGSPRHLDDKDGGLLTFADPLGDVSGGTLGESTQLLAKAKERELLMAFF